MCLLCDIKKRLFGRKRKKVNITTVEKRLASIQSKFNDLEEYNNRINRQLDILERNMMQPPPPYRKR